MSDGIDVHGHGVPRQFLEEVKRTRLGGVDVAPTDKGGYIVTFPGCKPLRPAAGIMLDFANRLGWLDGQGMQQQLIGPWLDVHGQELPATFVGVLEGQTYVTSGYLATLAALLILAGALADYYGRRRIFGIGLVLSHW